jgi:DNA repair protein RadC
MNYSLQQIPIDERPRERLKRQGPEALTTAELVAILLGSGIQGKSVLMLAQELVNRFGSLRALSEATIAELREVKGLGEAKAIQLKAAFSLGAKAASQINPPKFKISNPVHAYNLLKEELECEKREIFICILQDAKGYVISHEVVSIGSLTESMVHPREVFYPAIRHKAASIILAHNHPSGDPTPSESDYQTTKALVNASHLISIPIHDHIIIGLGRYVSLRQLGVAF